jgi:hypothetical protein
VFGEEELWSQKRGAAVRVPFSIGSFETKNWVIYQAARLIDNAP